MAPSPHVVYMNKYRKAGFLERLVAALAYPAFMYVSVNFGGFQLFTFILLFLVVWVVTRSKQLNAPIFVKYHVAHGFALAILADLLRMVLFALFDFVDATWRLMAGLPAIDAIQAATQTGFGYLMASWFYLMLGVALYHFVLALMGKQQEWPLAGLVAKRLAY